MTCEHLTKVGLEEKERRDKELVVLFRVAYKEACLKVQEMSVQKVKEFEDSKEVSSSVITVV